MCADLVPRAVMNQWLTYLRGFYPTVAFKASTQQQRAHLGQVAPDAEQAPDSALHSAEARPPAACG
jgi:nuclear GTP-binding protein